MSRITAIVPAYNEAARIGAVLETLTTYPNFVEVIVVDDGSTDRTGEIARRFPLRYIRNETNRGKGNALDRGVALASTDLLFFCDADITGLTHENIREVCAQVLAGTHEMCIGMHNRKIYALRMILTIVPLVGGERVLTRRLWNLLPAFYKNGFRIEPALNFYAKYYGKGYTYRILTGLSRTIKEVKYGVWEGVVRRILMHRDQTVAELRLQFNDLPVSVRNQRGAMVSFVGTIFGIYIASILARFHSIPSLRLVGILLLTVNIPYALLKLRQLYDLVGRPRTHTGP